ncbi:MAG: hypothetical protein GEU28_03240 [Dehalococcoidia bacterium]|nr:hypothetical protein [Dehalococcoidia bacterium]
MAREAPRHVEIQVELSGEGADVSPAVVEIRGNAEKVNEVLATWTEGGQGPAGRVFSRRANRTFFRVRVDGGAVYEIAHELPQQRKGEARWILIQTLQTDDEGAPPPPQPTPKAKSSGSAAVSSTTRKASSSTGATRRRTRSPKTD